MGPSRRSFLKSGSLFGLCAAIPAAAADLVMASFVCPDQKPPRVEQNNLDYFNRETFAPYRNTTFRVKVTPSSQVELTLIKVTDLMTAAPGAKQLRGRESFALLFMDSGSTSFRKGNFYATRLLWRPYKSAHLVDNSYEIEHDALGKFALFLVAVGNSSNPQRYEAIVNRM